MTESERGAATAASDGPQRVVLRGVRALVLDDMPDAEARRLLEQNGCEARLAWVAEASGAGTVEAAVKSHAGQSGAPDAKPGTYKALPVASWRVPAMVIEPPLP